MPRELLGEHTTEVTEEQKKAAIALVTADLELGTVEALRRVGVVGSKGEIRRLVKADPELVEEFHVARGYGREAIRAEIKRRAIDGVLKPVFQGGKRVGEIREYSDRLLTNMAKANLPEYRDKVEVTGSLGPGGEQAEGQRGVSMNDALLILVDSQALSPEAVNAFREAGLLPAEVVVDDAEVVEEPQAQLEGPTDGGS